jgi:hypothetical protein
MKHTAYIDEAGNTGDDLTAQDQPLFTIAVLGVPNEKLTSLETEIISLRQKYRLQSTQEIKAITLLGTKNEPLLIDIYNLILENNCLPFFTVIEKRYMSVGRMIEDLFDPAYNDKTDNSWTYPSELKTELANYFYDNLSDDTILKCANAFQKGKYNTISDTYNSIVNEIKGKQFRINVEETINGAYQHLDELSEIRSSSEQSFRSDYGAPSGVLYSPNFTSYFDLLSRLEDFYRRLDVSEVSVVFDSSRQFNSTFKAFFELISQSKQNEIILPNGKPIIFGFSKLKTFTEGDSKSSVHLQLSDILASSVNQFFIKLTHSTAATHFTKSEVYLIGIIYTLLDNRFGDWIVSSKLKHKFGRVFKSEGEKLGKHE